MTAHERDLRVTPLSGALGAEIHDLDLSRALGEKEVAAIRAAWLDHLVIVFRDQALSAEQFLAFARRIGRPVEYPFVKGIPDYPEIIEVKKLEHETVNFGGIWHSDTTYLANPPMASMLLAREVPPAGGDTLFANMYLAYETLSAGMKTLLDGLVAVNSSAKADVSATRHDRIASQGLATASETHEAEHPVVRVHPESGRRALFVNVAHTVRFKDMTEAESAGLLDYLFSHQVRPEFTCRIAWQPGTLTLWDNRCTQHNPINDYQGFRRVMQRITLAESRRE
ncbi:MAG: TauD/TfdA family dioxygenase [Pseudomonadales bacterium]